MKNILALLVTLSVLVAVFGGLNFAQADGPSQAHYKTIRDEPSLTHDEVSTIDSSTVGSGPLAGHYKRCRGNPKATATVLFSEDGAKATLSCYLWLEKSDGTWVFLGKQDYPELSATATGAFPRPSTTMPEWDLRGATHYEIRVLALDTGTITVAPWAYGADTGRE